MRVVSAFAQILLSFGGQAVVPARTRRTRSARAGNVSILFTISWILDLKFWWAHSSVVERVPDKNEVVGSIPTAPTKSLNRTNGVDNRARKCIIKSGL